MHAPVILAHRCNLRGPQPALENTPESFAACVQAGFGAELDLRWSRRGELYISHDPRERTGHLLWSAFRALVPNLDEVPLALNLKEPGREKEIAALAARGYFGGQAFLFDMEVLEPGAPGRTHQRLRPLLTPLSLALASRLSDRGESILQCLSIKAEICWADECDTLWLEAEDFAAVRAAGRRVFVVSPELHGCPRETRLARWNNFRAWGIDGLCTDFPLEARDFFSAVIV